jgi:hypothetical protein
MRGGFLLLLKGELMMADILACAHELREVLALPELDVFNSQETPDLESNRAAFWLAVALGRCRLFGVDLHKDEDGALPPKLAAAAAFKCSKEMHNWGEVVTATARQWDAGDFDDDCELEAGNLVFVRMDFWAAYIAIEEGYQAWLVAGDEVAGEGLRKAFKDLTKASRTLDDIMQSHLDVICTAAATEMLTNWRSKLAEPFRTVLPWWLDGSLEKAWREVQKEVKDSQPRKLPAYAS